MSSSGWVPGEQEATEANRSIGPSGAPWSPDTISVVKALCHVHQDDQWLNFDRPIKYPLLVNPTILESRVKKVLVDDDNSINVTLPRTLQALGISIVELIKLDTPFFDFVPTEAEYPLRHLFMTVTFSAPDNYHIEFLRFEVARFECGYNVNIERLGLAKFMAISHYPYMILKLSRPQGIITVQANFQGAVECDRGAVQTSLTAGLSAAPPTMSVNASPGDDLTILANEASTSTTMRLVEETKKANLGFPDERKTTIISSSLTAK